MNGSKDRMQPQGCGWPRERKFHQALPVKFRLSVGHGWPTESYLKKGLN